MVRKRTKHVRTEGIFMKKRLITIALAGVIAASMFAGCASKHSTRETPAARSDRAAGEYTESVSMNAKSYTNGVEYDDTFALADYEEFYDESYNGPIEYETPGSGGGVNIDPSKGRLLIRTVSITAETTRYAEVAANLEGQVRAAGGYIEYSSMRGTGNNKDLRTGTYTVRVPADKLDELIANVGNSCTVTSSNEGTSDVTLEYVDTKARIESLRVEYDQLLQLLSQAQDLDTIIILQNRITDVRYEIESAESRIRVLENQVEYATLTLTLIEVLEEKEVEEAHVVTYGEKVMNQFKDMWENTVEFFQDLLLGIIAIIPGLIFIGIITAVILIIVFSARKKRRKARAAKALAAKKAAEEAEKQAEEKKAAEKKAEEKTSSDKNETKEDKKEEKKENVKE